MTDIWLLVVTSLAIDLTPFRHAEANREFKSSITTQAREASVSEDPASIDAFWYCRFLHVMFTVLLLVWSVGNTEDRRRRRPSDAVRGYGIFQSHQSKGQMHHKA
jgi:hypothetical protein